MYTYYKGIILTQLDDYLAMIDSMESTKIINEYTKNRMHNKVQIIRNNKYLFNNPSLNFLAILREIITDLFDFINNFNNLKNKPKLTNVLIFDCYLCARSLEIDLDCYINYIIKHARD